MIDPVAFPDPLAFLANGRGAVSADRLLLGAGALLILGMAGYELFDAGFGALLSTVDPDVEKFAAKMELAGTQDVRN